MIFAIAIILFYDIDSTLKVKSKNDSNKKISRRLLWQHSLENIRKAILSDLDKLFEINL